MKQLIFITTILLSALCFGCGEKDNDDGITENEITIDGITFKFYLLNRQGQPATVFNEGENFIFNFAIVNKLERNICISTEFIDANFYRIEGINNTDMGKAWTGIWCNFSNEKRIIDLPSHENKQLNCPWLLSDNFQVDYPLCKGESMNPLPRGEYTTALDFDFLYTIDEKQKSIEDIAFKINFKIK